MTEDFYEKLVLAIAPAITERTLLNLRHILEQQYILATAQDASPEQQRAYSAEVVAKAELASAYDNARTIAFWARAIVRELDEENHRATEIDSERQRLASAETVLQAIQKGTAYPTLSPEQRQRQTEGAEHTIREAKSNLSRLTQSLPDLRTKAPAGDSSQGRPTGSAPARFQSLPSDLPEVS